LALAVGAALPVQAHHSFAMFDRSKTVTLVGVVKEWQWLNPHSWLQLYVTDASGAVVEWSIEGRSPNVLSRRGWNRNMLKPGDKVTVVAYPLKTGAPSGAFAKLTLASGVSLDADTPTAVDPAEETPRRLP
jgi:hypothetical protein